MRLAAQSWLIVILALIAAVAAFGLAINRNLPDPHLGPAMAKRAPNPSRGAYIATLGDCAACHTTPGGAALAGGVPLATPLGSVYSTNITPDREHGIGAYSFTDFARVMRQGVRPDGARLYPAMPYTAYAKVSDEDLQDLFAYLTQKVAAAPAPDRVPGIPWLLRVRWPLALWNKAFLQDARFAPEPAKGAAWNRGAYLVQGLAHCGTCHTPRGLGFQEISVDGGSAFYLSGARLAGESPVNLRGNAGDGLGRWSADEIAELLATGRSPHAAVLGQMGEVVAQSTQFMTPDDRSAIAAYLKSLPPAPEEGRATYAPSGATLAAFMAGRESTVPGARMFMDSCAACHRLSGEGEGRSFPHLGGSPTVLAQHPDSLIRVILKGARLPATEAAPSRLAMPPFGWRYDDQQVAALASFVRQSWGNNAAAVSAEDVERVRKGLR